MRRTLIVLVLLALALSAGAESILDFDGYDWIRLTEGQQTTFVVGFWMAIEAVIEAREMYEEAQAEAAGKAGITTLPQGLTFEPAWLSVFDPTNENMTVGSIRFMLDAYYEKAENRPEPIWSAWVEVVYGW